MAAEPSVSAFNWQPPYALRDAAGRDALLAQLTQLMTALPGPAQVWHGPRRVTPTGPGSGSEAQFTASLAVAARARQTMLIRADQTAPSADWRTAVGEHSRHVSLSDGGVGCVLGVVRWPAAVTPDWLSALTRDGVDVSLHLRPVDRATAGRVLRRRVTAFRATELLDARTGREQDPDTVLAVDTAQELRLAVARGISRLLRAQLLLAVSGVDVTDLGERVERLHELLDGMLATVAVLAFEQRPAWEACAPGGRALGSPWRLLDATTVAATIPHPAGEDLDSTGVLAGVEPVTGVPLLRDRFAAHNPTRLVVGTSGAGKSYAAKLEVLRHLTRDIPVIVVDPEGEFTALGDAAGVAVRVGEEPAGLDPVSLACDPQLPAAEGLQVLASWASALCGGTLDPADLAVLDRALAVLRADRGSTPTPGDLLSVVSELVAHPPFLGSRLAGRLAPATGGALADLFAPNPDLQQAPPLVVFDLRAVPTQARAAVMACVLAWSWTRSTSDDASRLVVIDEAHLLLGDPAAAELLATFARRARKYRIALDVVTQRLSDFLGHPNGEAVLANAATTLLLGCEEHERAAITSGLRLTEAERSWLQPGRVGRGLLVTSTMRTPIQIVADDAEHIVASSGPRIR